MAPRAYLGGEYGGNATVVEITPDARFRLAIVRDRQVFWVTATVAAGARFEWRQRELATIATAGAPASATSVPLASGAPAVSAGQVVRFGCPELDGTVDPTRERAVIARSAEAGAKSWSLRQPLRQAAQAGGPLSFERTNDVAAVAALQLTVGDVVYVEFAGAPDRYVVTLLAKYV